MTCSRLSCRGLAICYKAELGGSLTYPRGVEMAKLRHNNLAAYGDRNDVYEILQNDFNRDTYIQAFWHVIFFGAAFGAVVMAKHSDWAWLFLGIYAAERAIAKFIDNSNRNWTMHVIDWMERNRIDGAD